MGTIVSTGQITIVDVNDGLSAALTASSAVLPADAAGVVPSFSGAETTLKITEGGVDTSAQWAFSVSATGGGISYRDSDDTADKTGTGSLLGSLGGVNLRTRSQALDDAAWSKSGVTVGANNQLAPDNTMTADTLNNTPGSTSIFGQFVGMALSTTYTDSLYVKPLTANKALAMVAYTGVANVSCLFDLNAQTAGAGGAIASAGNGWFRISFTFTTAGSGSPSTTWTYLGGITGFSASSVAFAAWGAQLVPGSLPGAYCATDAVTRSGAPGYLRVTGLSQALSYLDITAERDGTTITRRFSIAKALAGAPGGTGSAGERGSLTGYGTAYGMYLFSSAWVDNSNGTSTWRANRVIQNMLTGATLTTDLMTTTHLRIGDTVTLTDAATATTAKTKYWSGSGWVTPGTVIDGNLMVKGTVSANELNVQSGSVGVSIAGSTPVTNAAGSAITNGAYIYQNSTALYGLYARNLGLGGAAYFESPAGTTIDCFHNSTTSGAAGNFRSNSSNTSAVGLTAIGYHGARISNAAGTQVGLIGTSVGKCFYAETGTFGPFTGAHDALLARGTLAQVGDIMVDFALVARKGVSDTLFEVRLSSQANQAAVIGVHVESKADWSGFVPAALIADYEAVGIDNSFMMRPVPADGYDEAVSAYELTSVNAVGEGQINVCGEGGDLQAGDLIVTSSLPGKGMRQSDDLVRATTVAKCRESVVFSSPGDVRLVACIYLCG